jgi:hypothetical protein
MVSCNLCSNVSSCSDATWQSFYFLQGDIYYQKNSNQNKNKAKHYAQRKKTSVAQKNQQKKCSTKKPANKKKSVPQEN